MTWEPRNRVDDDDANIDDDDDKNTEDNDLLGKIGTAFYKLLKGIALKAQGSFHFPLSHQNLLHSILDNQLRI